MLQRRARKPGCGIDRWLGRGIGGLGIRIGGGRTPSLHRSVSAACCPGGCAAARGARCRPVRGCRLASRSDGARQGRWPTAGWWRPARARPVRGMGE
eukprot:68659-Prymnesium_polylepis.1